MAAAPTAPIAEAPRLVHAVDGLPPRRGRQEFFSEQLPQGMIIQGRLGQQLLELPVLPLKLPKPPGLVQPQSAEARLPVI